jgi:broad specificity phosphatase PhoE
MNLLFIRHAQDVEGFRGGWSELGLSAGGRQQAKALGDYLQTTYTTITGIESSDLTRAKKTTQILLEYLHVPVTFNSDWREINNGELAGMPNAVAEQKFPNLYFSSLDMNEPYPSGESPRAFYNRIEKVFARLLAESTKAKEDKIIVTHGGVINVIYHIVTEQSWTNKNKSFPCLPASLHQLTHTSSGWHFTLQNHTAY